ncbi:MAG: PKD domain-containing protein [Opitutales bacterium]|nr:PKD domain-containing protein [Opitutales bacterium]
MRCLLTPVVFLCSIILAHSQSSPHLLISPERLDEIRDAVEEPGSTHEEMLSILTADVDASYEDIIDGGDRSLPGRNYARGFLAKKAAMVYAVTEDPDYAEIAFDALEAMYDGTGGNVLPDGVGGKGLERANVGKAYAVAYDLAKPGWTPAQRDFVEGKIMSSLDYWEGGGFRFDNDVNPYASNWVAVCYGSNLLQMLVLNEQSARSSHYNLLVNRLNTHMSHYGDKGWTQEGNYYMAYAQQYLIPAIHALRRKGDTRLDNRVEEKGMYLIAMYAGAFDAAQSSTQWGVGGNDFGTQGWTSMIFSIVPEDMLGAYRWFYDRHRGILNEAPPEDRYDPGHAGMVYAMMFYPDSVEPEDPASLLSKGLLDDKGGYWFRSGWEDENDLIVSLGTDTTSHGNAWDEADALQVNILGFGNRFSGGPGTSRDARFFSQVTVDGQARSSQSSTGTAEFFEVDDEGGYAIAGGGSKFGGLGVTSSRRHLMVSYPDDDDIAIVSTFDKLRAVQLREYAWQLNEQNLPLYTGEENGVPTFTLRGEDGAYLKGWVMYPEGGEFSNGNPLAYSFEGNDVDIWVVMAMGRGAAPEARIYGEGLDAELELGLRRVRWNDDVERIETLPANQPVPTFTISAQEGTAPLTVSFTPTQSGGNPEWDFGDGNNSTAEFPTHTFNDGGVYPITLTQDDGSGGRLRATHYVSVLNNAPLAMLSASPNQGEAPLTVDFDASGSTDPDGHSLSYTWDFGDGSAPVTGATASHTYTEQGAYFASVSVEDGHGGVGGAVQLIEVGNQAPTPRFSFTSTFGIPPVTVDFDASDSTDPEGDPLSFSWDFGDGSTASGETVTHTFSDYGEFEVHLTVDDGQGNERSTSQVLRIENQPPVPDFTFSPASGNAPLAVDFDASGSSDPEGQALVYSWDFGDGSTGSGVAPSHTYEEAINTQVQLTVTDEQGAVSTMVKPISILDEAGRRAPEFAPDSPSGLLPGVAYQLYNADVWRRVMGDINTLTPVAEGVLPTFDIRFRTQGDRFAYRFTGYIYVPTSGDYTFRARVRDNLHFYLGGLEVIHTGTGKKFSGPETFEGTVGLNAGYHAFEANFHASDSNASDWFPVMDISWEGEDFEDRQILPEELFWAPGAPKLDFLVSPDRSQMVVPEMVNFIPDDPVGTETFYQTEPGEPLILNFEAGPSSAPDGEIVSYLWNFGNEAVGAGRTASQPFTEGNYVVTLTVETESGAQFTTGRSIRVLSPPERTDYGRDASMRISANGQFLPTTGPGNLFDGSIDTRWLVNEPEGFVEVHYEEGGRRYGVAIDEFTLTNPDAWNDRDPKDLVFSGTMDGVNWTSIQTWENLDWEGQTSFTKAFPVANTTAYTGYRWDIVPQAESPQGWFVELYQIEMFGNAPGMQPEVRAPVAVLDGPGAVEKGQPFVLDASDSVSPDGYPLMYFWDFGDGQTARTVFPEVSHRIFDEGTYQVRLQVRDIFGNLVSASVHSLEVGPNTNQDPVADFSFSMEGAVMVFDASASSDADGDPLTYRWDFGNGITSVGMVTSHQFNPGVFSVTLEVEDGRGGRATLSQVVDARPEGFEDLEVISLNFTTGHYPLDIQTYENAGAVPVRFWNNLSSSSQTSGYVDNNNDPVAMNVSPQVNRNFRNSTNPTDTSNARMLATAWGTYGSSATYELSAIPYEQYDLYVYFAGGRGTPPETQIITVNGESLYIRDETGGWNGVLEESTATSSAEAVDGPAYVVFRELDTSSVSIYFSGRSDTGPSGIQVVNTSSRELPVVAEWPTASELDLGQRLSDVVLSGGMAVDGEGTEVPGSFAFLDPDFQPETGTDDYAIRFVPNDPIQFQEVDGTLSVTVAEGTGDTFYIVYHPNGGNGAVPLDDNAYLAGETVSVLEAVNLSREGMHFSGWRDLEADLTYQPGDTFLMGSEDVNLYAEWQTEGGGGTDLLLEEMFAYGDSNLGNGYGAWKDGTNLANYASSVNGDFGHESYNNSNNGGGALYINNFHDLRGVQLTFTEEAPVGTFWISAQIRKTGADAAAPLFLSLHDGASYDFESPVGAGFGLSGDGTNLLPVYRAADGSLTHGEADGYELNEFHLLLAKVTVGAGADSLSLWVKKSTDSFDLTEASLGTADLEVEDADFGDALRNIWVGQRTRGGHMDAIRISSLSGDDGLAQVLGRDVSGSITFEDWIAHGDRNVPVSLRGPMDHPAGDGVPNLLKYAMGLEPMERAVDAGPWMEEMEYSEDRFPALRFYQRSGGTGLRGVDYTADGIRYRVEVSTDLVEWHSGVDEVMEVHTFDAGEFEETIVRTQLPMHEYGRQFMRLVVEMVE